VHLVIRAPGKQPRNSFKHQILDDGKLTSVKQSLESRPVSWDVSSDAAVYGSRYLPPSAGKKLWDP